MASLNFNWFDFNVIMTELNKLVLSNNCRVAIRIWVSCLLSHLPVYLCLHNRYIEHPISVHICILSHADYVSNNKYIIEYLLTHYNPSPQSLHTLLKQAKGVVNTCTYGFDDRRYTHPAYCGWSPYPVGEETTTMFCRRAFFVNHTNYNFSTWYIWPETKIILHFVFPSYRIVYGPCQDLIDVCCLHVRSNKPLNSIC